jgi:hypothetical protein
MRSIYKDMTCESFSQLNESDDDDDELQEVAIAH